MVQTLKKQLPHIVKTCLLFLASALPFVLLSFMLLPEPAPAQLRIRTLPHPPRQAQRALDLPTRQQAAATAAAPIFKVRVGYAPSVLRTLLEMRLSTAHLDAWIDQHPGTALAHVRYMPEEMQKNVASTALFIRKTNPKIDERTAWREAAAFVHYSAKYGVPYALTAAVAHAESTFNPDAVSPKGASGVMQIMWRVHNGLLQSHGIHPEPGSNPLADPEKAIAAGCLLLSRYIRTYGSVQTAMNRYYGGNSSAYRTKIARNLTHIMNHRAQWVD